MTEQITEAAIGYLHFFLNLTSLWWSLPGLQKTGLHQHNLYYPQSMSRHANGIIPKMICFICSTFYHERSSLKKHPNWKPAFLQILKKEWVFNGKMCWTSQAIDVRYRHTLFYFYLSLQADHKAARDRRKSRFVKLSDCHWMSIMLHLSCSTIFKRLKSWILSLVEILKSI